MSTLSTQIEQIWGSEVVENGFVQVPKVLIRFRRKLNIEHGEMSFLTAILSYKFGTSDPFPSRETLAAFMDVSLRQIDKWSASLRKKRFLLVYSDGTRTKYSIQPLIERLKMMCSATEPEVQRATSLTNEPVVQLEANKVALPVEPLGQEVQDDVVPEVRTEYSTEYTSRISKDPDPNPKNIETCATLIEYEPEVEFTESDQILWDHVQKALQTKFSPSTFATWFGDTRAFVRNGVVTVCSSIPFVAKWVEEHYRDLLLQTFMRFQNNIFEIQIKTA
ncbi:DnaA-like protein [Alicyclobacillus sacchari]|uniref:DnaA-like protein n=1 Tax=Alicyclobacillus sacchari TaxID=392010 RepID=A0A4R8LBN0_9BACL|nr:DnaA N-terminal domain-containing protein [Alicyclobacillus sacchari]TDY40352.1 DnaA-like protein [Alicyclobacillus sacchari]GMA59480.1 hypothetical protein GCM10025858_39840 [Alicyclobacillus sacchari]